jgi:excisionase family DNA binding protein
MTTQLLYTTSQAAEMLSIGRTSVYELINSGRLQSVKIGACRRVPAIAISDYVASLVDEVTP